MDPYPVIPENDPNHDISNILIDEFQNVLTRKKFPDNVAQNVDRNIVKYEFNLKESAEKVRQIVEVNEFAKTQLQNTEYELMVRQALYENRKLKIKENDEFVILKHDLELFPDIDPEMAREYALIRSHDLQPHPIDRALDFRYHSVSDDISSKKKRTNFRTTKSRAQKECDKLRYDVKPSKRTQVKVTKSIEKIRGSILDKSPIFVLENDDIQFVNCLPEPAVYTKRVFIRNQSKHSHFLKVWRLPLFKGFTIHEDRKTKIPPQMKVCITIQLRLPTTEIRNFQDLLTLVCDTGEKLKIPISVTSRNPSLEIGFFYCLLPDMCGAPGVRKRIEIIDDEINLHCGTCLVEEISTWCFEITNNGVSCRFCWISEEEWNADRLNLNDIGGNYLIMENFVMYPRLFELRHKETIYIKFILKPHQEGFFMEKFVLMASNNNYRIFYLSGETYMLSHTDIEFALITHPEEKLLTRRELIDITLDNPVVQVRNKSPVYLRYYWGTESAITNCTDYKLIHTNIKVKDDSYPYLEPMGHKNVEIEVHRSIPHPGYFSLRLCFYLENIPLLALQKYEKFIVTDTKLNMVVDVLFNEVELGYCGYVLSSIQSTHSENTIQSISQETSNEGIIHEEEYSLNYTELGMYDVFGSKPTQYDDYFFNYTDMPIQPIREKRSNIFFSQNVVQIGILPPGVELQQEIIIKSVSKKSVKFRVYEIMYNPKENCLIISSKCNVTPRGGVIESDSERILKYNVTGKEPIRWASVLVLQAIYPTCVELESFCIIAYEKLDMDIRIRTMFHDAPILCPFTFLYKDSEYVYDIYIQNKTLIRGTYSFLKPYGKDSDKIKITLIPDQGILPIGQSTLVKVYITPLQSGVLDEIVVPCFVGIGQSPLDLRIMLVVDTVHVYFFLPIQNNFEKIKWPQTTVQKYDLCICGGESDIAEDAMSDSLHSETSLVPHSTVHNVTQVSLLRSTGSTSTFNSAEIREAYFKVCHEAAEHDYPTKFSFSDSILSEQQTPILENELREQMGENIILQKNIVELSGVAVKTLTKFTFYIENITTIKTNYSTQATNFFPSNEDYRKPLNQLLLKMKQKTSDEVWSSSIQSCYGIVITPDQPEGVLKDFDVLQIDYWIYAKTFGIYMEEIVVHLEDIPSFTFSLLVEAVGEPIMFPFALNMITQFPTIRLGHIPYKSSKVQRKLKVVNCSNLPLTICFHVFVPNEKEGEKYRPFNLIFDMKGEIVNYNNVELYLKKAVYGKETNMYLTLSPHDLVLEEYGSGEVDLIFDSCNFLPVHESKDVTCYLLAFVYLQEDDGLKINYYYRRSGKRLKPKRIDVLATMELPRFTLDFLHGDNIHHVYANEILLNNIKFIDFVLFFENKNFSPIHTLLHIDEPFKVHSLITSDGIESKDTIYVRAGKRLEVVVRCELTQEFIYEVSELVFRESTDSPLVDMEKNCVTISRNLNIHQRGLKIQTLPMELTLYFPIIEVDPGSIKFGNVLLENTKKNLLCIKNLSDAEVTFEIYKTCPGNVIRVSPNHGKIPRKLGMNPAFVNVFVYFTPKILEQVSECIRICTNIPKYFIDIPVFGDGICNEKFYIHHHI